MLFSVIAGLLISSPLWLPIVFLAYMIGRHRFGTKVLLLLLMAEGIALGVSLFVVRVLDANSDMPPPN
jgi:hypothetical protein